MSHASPLENTLSNSKGDVMPIRKPEIKHRVNLSKKNLELLFMIMQSFISDIASVTSFELK